MSCEPTLCVRCFALCVVQQANADVDLRSTQIHTYASAEMTHEITITDNNAQTYTCSARILFLRPPTK